MVLAAPMERWHLNACKWLPKPLDAEQEKTQEQLMHIGYSPLIKRGLWLGFILLILACVGFFARQYAMETLTKPHKFERQSFVISKGDTLKDFVSQLQKVSLVNEPYTVGLYARYKNLAGRLHTGYYQFPDDINLLEVLDAVTTGKFRMAHHFTFVQGSTYKQLRASLRKAKGLKQTLQTQSDVQILNLMTAPDKYKHLEGLFFPDTYAYDPGTSDVKLLKRAFDMMQSQVDKLWAQRAKDLPFSTPYEALILASIIEKETSLPQERALIAGVFINRLRKGMRLQTDPTVIYGLGDAYKGDIKRAHLTTDTPYNTYTRKGLTPTPISMPGKAAIYAALHPKKTQAIFFVAKGDGSRGHNFSKTYDQHKRAVKQYLAARRGSG